MQGRALSCDFRALVLTEEECKGIQRPRSQGKGEAYLWEEEELGKEEGHTLRVRQE